MYMVISFSHENTDIDLREKLNFDDVEILKFLPLLHKIDNLAESILLSTCNRCEIYLFLQTNAIKHANATTQSTMQFYTKGSMAQHYSTHSLAKLPYNSHTTDMPHLDTNMENTELNEVAHRVIVALSEFKKIEHAKLENIANIMIGDLAIHHVFCVASSLLSAVLGETQISGQLKNAYKLSYDNHFCKKELTRLIHFAFKCAANVRGLTEISKNPISVASVAVNVAMDFLKNKRELHDDILKPKILVIGVGEMGVLCLKHLAKHNVSITLCNRTKEHAKQILSDLSLLDSIKILDFNTLSQFINDYDIILSATAGGAIIHYDMIKEKETKRMFFDLSIPRNFSFDMQMLLGNHVLNIEIVDIDTLKEKAQKHIDSRKESLKEAMGIVGKFVVDFQHWLASLGVDPLIKIMRLQAKEASLKEINKAIKKGFIPEALRENVTKLVHNAFNEFLHSPTMRLKAMTDNENADTILESIANVFGQQDRILLNRYKCEYDDLN